MRWERERAAWRRGKFAHAVFSQAGVEAGAQEWNETTILFLRNAALLHGRWYLLQGSSGSLANLSCYWRQWGVPGWHATRTHLPHEDEDNELAERARPRSLTDDCFMILGGPWQLTHCDIACPDGTALALCAEAVVHLRHSTVGAAGFVGRSDNGSWACDHYQGRARFGLDLEASARAVLDDADFRKVLVQNYELAGVAAPRRVRRAQMFSLKVLPRSRQCVTHHTHAGQCAWCEASRR